MSSSAIVTAFHAALERLGPDLPASAIPRRPAQGTAVSPDDARFFKDFAAPLDAANAMLDRTRMEARKTHGDAYVDEALASDSHHELKRQRRFDFRLQPEEMTRLHQQGFVVSQRLGAESFAEIYYRLYSDDMPVYVTADSVLHAWHRSFDAFLVDLEMTELAPALGDVLTKLRDECVNSRHGVLSPSVEQCARDVELFVVMAQSLLCGQLLQVTEATTAGLARELWKALAEQKTMEMSLFGATRTIDFSLFKPRGHYVKSETLQRYFQAMTWLGTIDFRVGGGEDTTADRYQLQCAVFLVHVLRASEMLNALSTIEQTIGTIAGDGIGCDSMTPFQLHELLPQQRLIETYLGPEVQSNTIALESLQAKVMKHGLGHQAITGHPIVESDANPSGRSTKPPVALAVLGQQFVWSSFIFSNLVYDTVRFKGAKVVRRLPSAVDIGFALFENDVAGEIAATRMEMSPDHPEFVRFRDGVPYSSSLLALKATVQDSFGNASATATSSSLGKLWVHALRALSSPSPNTSPVFHSRAWQLRQLNTQIASLAQLRHDTILYAKQSYTMMTRCEYAAGFVDPFPEFWERMHLLAVRCSALVNSLKTIHTENSEVKSKASTFFGNFADTMHQLAQVARTQVRNEDLNEEQMEFLKSVIEERFGSGGSRYLGWYPRLFYRHREDSGKKDHLVADVHTDTPSIEHGDRGGILHLGVGDVNMGFFVVDGAMFAGPVFSSYEFVTPVDSRLTDDDFSAELKKLEPPRWATESFLC